MAFTIANWGCQQPALNAGQETVNAVVLNTCNVFTYVSPNDAVATIVASNYFLSEYASLSVGDIIWGSGTDAAFAVQVTASTSTSVTVASMGLTTSIGTSNIVDAAVTFAKIQNIAAVSLFGNATGGATVGEEITLGNGLEFSGTTVRVPLAQLRYATVNMTLAQFLGMYATPFQILASPGASLMNIVHSAAINMHYGSAALVGGGAVGLQYGSTAHLAAPAASATEQATDFTGASASTMFRFEGSLSTGAVVSTAAATAVYISNDTAAFTVGTGATFTVDVWYSTVAAT